MRCKTVDEIYPRHTHQKKTVDEAQARSAELEIVHRHDPINSTVPLSILSNPKNNGLKKKKKKKNWTS